VASAWPQGSLSASESASHSSSPAPHFSFVILSLSSAPLIIFAGSFPYFVVISSDDLIA